MRVHARIVESILAGQNWGRQALVGSLEYPLFPTLMLLVSRVVLAPLGAGGDRWLVALCQVWALTYILRLSPTWRGRFLGLGILAASLLSPTVRHAVVALDPNWVLAVPMASVIYHLTAWHRDRELRDVVLCAVNSGLLGFCGFGGVVFAIGVLWMMCKEVRLVSKVNPEEQSGVKLLIWTPLAYCAFLWLLWNWLVMGDMLYCLGRVVDSCRAFTLAETLRGVRASLFAIPVLVPATVVLLCLILGTAQGGIAACLAVGLVGIFAVRTLAVVLELHPAGAAVAGVVVCIAGLILPWMPVAGKSPKQPPPNRLLFARLLTVPVLLLSFAYPGVSVVAEGAFAGDAPPRREITACIDQYWPNSRTAVYGIRLPAIYHDPRERRFVARLDYHRDVFLRQARKEQMYLLVPPSDGRFYARRVTPFAVIHAQGARWLFLEREWRATGWQLWRCVIPPEGESKLRGFR
jgi:hypothetical protein